jgi:hypothetical protein
MNCLLVRDQLFSYYENTLSERETEELQIHLRSCKECSALSAGYLYFNEFIRQKKSVQPSPFIHTRTLQRIESELTGPVAWYQPFKKLVFQPSIFFLILTIAVGSGAFMGWYLSTGVSSDSIELNTMKTIRNGLSIDDFIVEEHLFLANQGE